MLAGCTVPEGLLTFPYRGGGVWVCSRGRGLAGAGAGSRRGHGRGRRASMGVVKIRLETADRNKRLTVFVHGAYSPRERGNRPLAVKAEVVSGSPDP
jgi:hypothetical protein